MGHFALHSLHFSLFPFFLSCVFSLGALNNFQELNRPFYHVNVLVGVLCEKTAYV